MSILKSVLSRDRLVVRTLRCGRSNPGSNPGHGMDQNFLAEGKNSLKIKIFTFNTFRYPKLDPWTFATVNWKNFQIEKWLRRPGIEPGSTAWKAAMLTIIPPSLVTPFLCTTQSYSQVQISF